MNILVVKQLLKTFIPKLIGLAGYKDGNKTSGLSALLDGSKFATFLVIIGALVISLLPVDVVNALIELIQMFAGE